MKTYSVELRGTITRDIKWYDVDADSEAEVREICAREMPYYKVYSVIEPHPVEDHITGEEDPGIQAGAATPFADNH